MKSWQAWAGLFFISYFWEALFTINNWNIFRTLVGFQTVASIALPACCEFFFYTHIYLVKAVFLLQRGETSCPFTPRLLCASAPPTAAAAAPLSAGWNSSDLMIFLLAVTLCPPHPLYLPPPATAYSLGFKASGICVPLYSWDQVVKHWIMFQCYSGSLWPFVWVPWLNWIAWVIICQVMLSRK